MPILTGFSFPLFVFYVLLAAWFTLESQVGRIARRPRGLRFGSSSQDQGSFGWIITGIAGSLILSLVLFVSGLGGFLPLPSIGIGVAVSAMGLTMRYWSISTLGRFFSPVIRIEDDHQIIRAGPYRWLRHPSYTGIWLACLGPVLSLGTISGSIATTIVGLAVLSHRIRLEESLLVGRFGREYEAYTRETWRLIPGIY
ncbi:MAG TPA: isoprenylcysteine carboxylmethyltransferase family protein [Thermoplasmata archaeon]|nr:isoprenylcysteine carboxylmethyltransferase family protein [Thermoplasmata archaeon]